VTGAKKPNRDEEKLDDEDEFVNDHFASSNSTLYKLLLDIYFPKIDCGLIQGSYKKEDVLLTKQHDKLIDSVVVELITL